MQHKYSVKALLGKISRQGSGRALALGVVLIAAGLIIFNYAVGSTPLAERLQARGVQRYPLGQHRMMTINGLSLDWALSLAMDDPSKISESASGMQGGGGVTLTTVLERASGSLPFGITLDALDGTARRQGWRRWGDTEEHKKMSRPFDDTTARLSPQDRETYRCGGPSSLRIAISI